jgi:BNR repeat-like domain
MNRKLSLGFILLLAISCDVKKKTDPIVLTTLPSPAQSPSGEPHLFTDEKGDVFLSWIEKKENINELKFSKLSGQQWSTPATIASDSNWFVNWADYPMLAANGDHFIAHFLAKSGDGTFAYDVNVTQSSDRGKTWSHPKAIHDDGKQAEHGFVSMLPYGENFFITWLDGRNTVMEGMENHAGHDGHHGEMSLRAAIVNTKGEKLNEWELDNRTCDCCQTSAAITSQGPVVVYRDRSDEEIRDMSIVRLIDGVWTKPKPIYEDQWKIAGCPVNGPRMAATENTLAIAWFSMPGEKSEVKVIFSKDGGESFGQPIQIDEGKAIGRVDLVLLDDKSVVVSWMEGSVIKAARVAPDGTKGASFIVAPSSEARSSGFPQMTQSGTELIFAWTNSQNKTIDVASAPIPLN